MNVKTATEKLAYAKGQLQSILTAAGELQAALPPIRADVLKRTGGHVQYESAITDLEAALGSLITEGEKALASKDLNAVHRVLRRHKSIVSNLSGPGSKFMLASATIYGTSGLTLHTICGASLSGLALLCHRKKGAALLKRAVIARSRSLKLLPRPQPPAPVVASARHPEMSHSSGRSLNYSFLNNGTLLNYEARDGRQDRDATRDRPPTDQQWRAE